MKNITIVLPEIYIESIEKLIKIGLYPSRSETIRIAVKDFLINELKIKKDLEKITEYNINENNYGQLADLVSQSN